MALKQKILSENSQLQNWDYERLKYEVRLKGGNLQQLAIKHRFHPKTFYHLKAKKLPRVHKVIAKFLGMPVDEIWPEFYTRQTPSTKAEARHV